MSFYRSLVFEARYGKTQEAESLEDGSEPLYEDEKQSGTSVGRLGEDKAGEVGALIQRSAFTADGIPHRA